MTEPLIPFASLFVALPTPFDDQGQIELPVVDLLVDYLLQQEVDGIAILTEAAEDAMLLPPERRSIIERVGERVAGQAKLLVGISAPSTREAVDLARLAESKGHFGVLMSPLGVPGLGYRELYRHVDRVCRATSMPAFLTVRPANALDVLTAEEQGTLAQHPALSGAFLSQSSQGDLKVWARRFKKRPAAIMTGCALSFGPAARGGATAAICALSMLALDPARNLLSALARGDVDAVRKIERRTEPAVSFLGPPRPITEQQGVEKLATKIAQRPLTGAASAPWVSAGMIKAGLELQGHKRVSARVRPPSEQPSRERVQRLGQILKSSELLT